MGMERSRLHYEMSTSMLDMGWCHVRFIRPMCILRAIQEKAKKVSSWFYLAKSRLCLGTHDFGGRHTFFNGGSRFVFCPTAHAFNDFSRGDNVLLVFEDNEASMMCSSIFRVELYHGESQSVNDGLTSFRDVNQQPSNKWGGFERWPSIDHVLTVHLVLSIRGSILSTHLVETRGVTAIQGSRSFGP